MAEPIPISQRPGDMALAAFFALNVLAITYMEGFEQLVIADPDHFEYPVWPPRFMVDAVHWWGRNYDPLLMARPTWWRVIIAIDATFFGPFYVCAVYAFVKGREWIRIPSIIWASVMLTMVAEHHLGVGDADDGRRDPRRGGVRRVRHAAARDRALRQRALGAGSDPRALPDDSPAPPLCGGSRGARRDGRGGRGRTVSPSASDFRSKYGPWALVAGASEGLGAEFARQLAAKGLNIVPIARRQALLEQLARELEFEHRVEVRPLAIDLSDPRAAAAIVERTRDLEVGLVVYNAALSPIGPFLERHLDEKLRVLDVNCRTPLILVHEFARIMAERGRGGLLLVSSMSALQGSPLVATYAATKAFGLILGEGLWEELRRHGVDVLAFCAGATRTPNFEASQPEKAPRFAPAPMEPAAVAAEALACLGKTPSAIAGRGNRLVSLLMHRLLPRRLSIEIMGRATRAMYEE